jgi:hypothetical protein
MRIPTTDQSIQINETIRYAPGSTLFLDSLMPIESKAKVVIQ